MATTLRNDAKKQIVKILRDQGYNKYAALVGYFDIYLTDDPGTVGYMVPNKAKIVLNKDLDIYQVSVIVRHEILHEYLTHAMREEAFNNAHPELAADHELMNVAADMEISNRGYTPSDKVNIRAIRLNGKKLQGIVTEDHDPSWTSLTFEEMYERLLQERQSAKDKIEKMMQQSSAMSNKELDKLEDDANDAAEQQNSDDSSDNSETDNNSSNTSAIGSEDGAAEQSPQSSPKSDDEDSGEEAEQSSATAEEVSTEDTDAEELAGEVKELKQQQEYIQSQRSNNPFRTPAEVEAQADIKARAEEIRKLLDNRDFMAGAVQETNINIRKERAEREKVLANARSRYGKLGNSSGSLSNFKLDLRRFLSSLEGQEMERSYKRFDPRYEGSGFIMPGKSRVDKLTVPKINVYWDTSGSFSNPAKTAGARAAIDTIQKYVKQGLIQTYTYYHSDNVYTTPSSGGNNGNNVIRHIQDTKPDNVIIITDGDLSDTSIACQVPGAVWMLFYDYPSDGLVKNLTGKKQSKWYMIEY